SAQKMLHPKLLRHFTEFTYFSPLTRGRIPKNGLCDTHFSILLSAERINTSLASVEICFGVKSHPGHLTTGRRGGKT
ncbi:MAG TPA: hypothetical protein VEP29_11025, partial [Desulfatiglandales bacterium]|nr:hypothetical protein [Desulfatiglandales bacterium]